MTRDTRCLRFIILGFCLLYIIGLSACQPQTQAPPTEIAVLATQPEQPSSNDLQAISPTPTTSQEVSLPDPATIEAAWQASPHALTFVTDAQDKNNSCARCHAPVEWVPSMEDLPESCYACKFELEEPPAYIPEESWGSIPCKVCHQSDKQGVVQAEYSWLEIAALEEYAEVATPTDLCMKCHAPVNIREHAIVQVGGAHQGYECTACHDAHSTTASCTSSDCHAEVTAADVSIPGHDDDHARVSCAACHDAAGMEVGPGEESEIWTTFAPWAYDIAISEAETKTETGMVAFTSHNLELSASCGRCHYAGNPWGLSEDAGEP